jgi:hypothetical protein
MPDFNNRAKDGARDGWSDAFAALPMETPPADSWIRITRALDSPALRRGAMRREHRMSWVIGLASAAVLAFVVWSPLSHWLQDESDGAHPTVAVTEAPGVRGPAAPLRNEAVATESGIKPAVDKVPVASSDAAPPKPVHRKPARSKRAIARQSRIETDTVLAASVAASATVQTETVPVPAATTGEDADSLQKLKAKSAQLEALLALALDERVANASSELLSSELESGIAAVDAALSQPGVADTRKQELWQRRVDLLQQLAGVEATSRWLAAQGASNETALVSVY